MPLVIRGKRRKLARLKKHLEKEHPSTKGKMKLKKAKKYYRKKKYQVKKESDLLGKSVKGFASEFKGRKKSKFSRLLEK